MPMSNVMMATLPMVMAAILSARTKYVEIIELMQGRNVMITIP